MALHMYRRHRVACGHRSQSYRRCQCPIYVKGTLGGTFIKMSLDQTSWDAASSIVADWTKAGSIGQVVDQSKTLADAVESYLTDAATRGLAKDTINKYCLLLKKRLIPFCHDNGYPLLKAVDLHALTSFRNTWAGGALAKQKTQERLKYFFAWCQKRSWIKDNPAEGLTAFKVQTSPTLPFTAEEMDRILAACDQYPARGIYGEDNPARVKAMVLLLRWTGFRIRDAVTMERQRFDGRKVFLYTQKTGTPVQIPVPEVVQQALAQMPVRGRWYFWSGNGSPKSAVANWQRSLRAVFDLANVPDGHAHRFRDTFAVECLLSGMELSDVSILLGHSTTRITEKHYAPWVTARQRRLESAVQRTWLAAVPAPAASGDTPAPPPNTESAPHDRPELLRVPA